MKKILLTLGLCSLLSAQAADTIFVKQPQVPILIERHDNVLFYLRMDATETKQFNEVTVSFDKNVPLSEIASLKLYYGGTEAIQKISKNRFSPVDYVTNFTPGKTLSAIPSYSIKKSEVSPTQNTIVLKGEHKLFPGINYFWVSVEMKKDASLFTTLSAKVESVKADGHQLPVETVSDEPMKRRMGIGVRHAGDDGSAAFRIPGLVTTNKGTVLAVYDVRYNSSVDMQERIDIGLSRSTDGGRTWEKMRLPMSFGETGGLPSAQNGVGDPAILVDKKTNTIWIVASWIHGMGNQRSWFSSHPGIEKETTGQLMLVKSTDDGQTWSDPINITKQVKRPEWYYLLQGPGKGITMDDGTLVFPIDYKDKENMPFAGIMYSKDRGKTWKLHNGARSNTTESQVVEIEPGVLMLNMRDNRGGSRAVSITRDLGQTWTEHPSNRSALNEPVCMASLIKVKAKDNALGKDLLIFSNPNTTKERKDMTIKVSFDNGLTWEKENQLLLDEGYSWGYSCLTMVDRETVAILYESSVAHMTYQCIKLKDLVR